jgi:hypothetical protein
MLFKVLNESNIVAAAAAAAPDDSRPMLQHTSLARLSNMQEPL